MTVTVTFAREAGADPSVPLPAYQTAGAAGADVRANLGADAAPIVVQPGARALIPTGLRVAVPVGFEMQLRPRSGLAFKHGMTLVNTPGTIDSDYRGALGVLMINLGAAAFEVCHGDRICQAVIAPVVQARFDVAPSLDETDRGAGGFGSTGVTS